MMTTNTTSTNEFAVRIKTLLSESTAAWHKIAIVLADAEEQFGYTSDRFKALVKEVAFSKATASKLIQIARDKRIEANASLFDTCNAWTVLYEITTLNAEQFDRLVETIECAAVSFEGDKGKKVLTVATVRAIKNADNKKDANPYRSAFTISIDVDALRTKEFDFENYEELMQHVRAIANEISFVKIEKSDIYEKQSDFYFRKMASAYDAVKYDYFKKVLQDCQKNGAEWKAYRSKKKAGVKNLKRPPLGVYSDFAEAKAHYLENPDTFFITMGADIPDPNDVAREASNLLEKKNRRFLDRLRSRPEMPTSEEVFDALDQGNFDEVRNQIQDIRELQEKSSMRSRLKKLQESKIAA